MSTAADVLSGQTPVAPLGLVVLKGAEKLGNRIDRYLTEWWPTEKGTYIVESECPRFSSGDSKGLIKDTVRGMDLYFILDIGNYSCTYRFFDKENNMSPDDHYQDLKRLIQAAGGKAHRITVIMPLLYGGRQHRRQYRESLDCAWMLRELESMGVSNVICFDAHDARVQNSVPLMGFDNVMPYYQVLKAFHKSFPELSLDHESFMVVSPDEGAMNRNIYYASVLGLEMGMFYKRRDYSQIVEGRNPIVAQEYLGASVEGKSIFIADDIISSGSTMIDIAYDLKGRDASSIFCYATYPLFTNGLEKFDKAYEDGVLGGVFGSNATYISPELAEREWFHLVDISKYAAYFISSINSDISVRQIIDPTAKINQLLGRLEENK